MHPLSQKSKIFASSPIGRAKGAAAPERERDIAVESKRRRALSERPYIYNGKCCEFAGRQWKFVMFVCREAERLPYERTGDWADLPGRGAGMGDCAAHLISQKSKIFATSPDKGRMGGAEQDEGCWERLRFEVS